MSHVAAGVRSDVIGGNVYINLDACARAALTVFVTFDPPRVEWKRTDDVRRYHGEAFRMCRELLATGAIDAVRHAACEQAIDAALRRAEGLR